MLSRRSEYTFLVEFLQSYEDCCGERETAGMSKTYCEQWCFEFLYCYADTTVVSTNSQNSAYQQGVISTQTVVKGGGEVRVEVRGEVRR